MTGRLRLRPPKPGARPARVLRNLPRSLPRQAPPAAGGVGIPLSPPPVNFEPSRLITQYPLPSPVSSRHLNSILEMPMVPVIVPKPSWYVPTSLPECKGVR